MDEFDEITAGLEDELRAPSDVPDYTELSDLELLNRWIDVKNDLLDRGVIIHQEDPADYDKHSMYYGMFWELQRRGLK